MKAIASDYGLHYIEPFKGYKNYQVRRFNTEEAAVNYLAKDTEATVIAQLDNSQQRPHYE